MQTFFILIISLSFLRYVNSEEQSRNEEDDVPVFEPTEEWQEIKPGQSIPPGLHVRVDLQTGMKEAKLMDREESDSTTGSIQLSGEASESEDTPTDDTSPPRSGQYGHSDRRGIINKATKIFTRKELSDMLRNLRDEGPKEEVPLLSGAKGSSDGTTVTNSQKSSSHESKFLSIEELRQVVTFHSDVEIMLQHLDILTNPKTTSEDLVASLHELEYYVHQIDNARDLDLLGGLVVVVRFLNHTENNVQSAAAFVLGAAAQGNPEVQERALLYQALPNLLTLLSPTSSDVLQRRALYALGSLLRGQPLAVEDFVSMGGIDRVSSSIEQRSEAVVIKIMTLLTDLLGFENLEEKTSITKSGISSALSINGWCYHVTMFLESGRPTAVEKSIHLMDKLKDECEFSGVLSTLEGLHYGWSHDDGMVEVAELIQEIIQRLRTRKDEL